MLALEKRMREESKMGGADHEVDAESLGVISPCVGSATVEGYVSETRDEARAGFP